jgi:hypothetical protein
LGERAPLIQQILESGVGSPSAEKLPNVVEVVGKEFAGEFQRERLAEIELFLVRYLEEFLGVIDIVWQYVQVVAELGITIELAGRLAQKGLMLAPAGGGDEFKRFLYVLEPNPQGFLAPFPS